VEQPIFVTRIAANTSLGDAATACAAARAGLSRPAAVEQEFFNEDGDPVPVLGHPVRTVSGFQGAARLLALALPALRELMANADVQDREKLGMFLALPDVEARATAAGSAAPAAPDVLGRLAEMAGLSAKASVRKAFSTGHAGFAQALQAALTLLASREVDRALVGGVDTLCDSLALEGLAAQGRLKTDDNPVGLQPGEAAAFLLLESAAGVQRRRAQPLAKLVAVGLAKESTADDAVPTGGGLTSAITQLVAVGGPLPAGECWFVLDLNGEERRAYDWGCCQPRLVAQMPGVLPAPEWTPAISFGDTGAASGPIAVQMMLRGFARGYAPTRCGVVLSSSDGSDRAAIRIERVN
jgi:3-oxoacyl-[acyl-carrier-protein] synthase-1